MGNFEDLDVWRRSRTLAAYIYQITAIGQFARDYGLRDQMRRAAVSIPSNIAEGEEYGTDKQAVKFFYVAKGSSAELLTQAIIATDVGYLDAAESKHIREECRGISKMLMGLIRARAEKERQRIGAGHRAKGAGE